MCREVWWLVKLLEKCRQLVRFAAMLLWMDIFGSSCRCHWDWSMFSELLGLQNHKFLDRLISELFHHEMLNVVVHIKKHHLDQIFLDIICVFLSSVCYQDSAGFQCTCEDQYRWSCDKCLLYGSCDNITDDTCGCLNALPPDGEYCQLSHQLSTF